MKSVLDLALWRLKFTCHYPSIRILQIETPVTPRERDMSEIAHANDEHPIYFIGRTRDPHRCGRGNGIFYFQNSLFASIAFLLRKQSWGYCVLVVR